MTPFRRVDLRSALFGFCALGAVGCGPVTTTQRVADATVSVEAARGIDAERYATYEYVTAVEYLRKAREEEGYSDYQAAIELAIKAREMADKAKARTREARARGVDAAREAAPVTTGGQP